MYAWYMYVWCMYIWCMYGTSLYATSGFYARKNVLDKICGFAYTLVKQNKKTPHLRCSAAQARALIPFGKELVDELFDDRNPEEKAAKTAMGHMFECYEALHGADDFVGRLTLHSRLFALQFVVLEEYFPGRWSVKPKLHQFLELCIDGGLPSANWNYRDEDFGGACSGMARRRGGLLGPTSTSSNLLTRYVLRTQLPRFIRALVEGGHI